MITHYLRHPVEANYIRVRPLAWVQLICLRLELYGCDIPGSPGRTKRMLSDEIAHTTLDINLYEASNEI